MGNKEDPANPQEADKLEQTCNPKLNLDFWLQSIIKGKSDKEAELWETQVMELLEE